MSNCDYQTKQSVIVLENLDEAYSAASKFLQSQPIIGLDCEWNSQKDCKISLIQVATFSEVLLFRLSKYKYWSIPEELKSVLENEKIIKLGVNIAHDAGKLGSESGCYMRGWVDLRTFALSRPAYGKVLIEKAKRFEEELNLVHKEDTDNVAANLEAKVVKKKKRYSWYPKLGLGSLSEDCLGLQLQKNSSARWKDDWEAGRLSEKQVNYAAADSAVALDIFLALCLNENLGDPITRITEDMIAPDKIQTLIDQHCTRFIHSKMKNPQTLCYALMASVDKEFDLTDYLTKNYVTKNDGLFSNKRKGKTERVKTPLMRMISNKPLYENCKLFSNDGTLLCTCNKDKIEWYLKKGLADALEQPEGSPIAAKLLFEPSGKPQDDTDFYCQEKVNQCCCCGVTEKLARKNVIPREYRKHLAEKFKNRQSHDVVLLCVRCHCMSNTLDGLLREELAAEHGVPVNHRNTFVVVDEAKGKARSAATALTSSNRATIPEERKAVLRGIVADYLGHEPTEDELSELKNLSKESLRVVTNDATDHGTEVIKKIMAQGKEEEFITRWRKFFLSSMKPRFLPTGWSVAHRTRDMECAEKKEERRNPEGEIKVGIEECAKDAAEAEGSAEDAVKTEGFVEDEVDAEANA